jgi:hypothetical protein
VLAIVPHNLPGGLIMFSFTLRRLIGAAAVVCLAASAVVVGSVAVPAQTLALPGASESTVVTIEPTRVADTRYDIGLTGQIAVNKPRKFTVTGPIDTYIDSTSTTVVKQVVPAGATGVFLNVTVVTPSEPGFLAIRPGTATGVPATGGLNFDRDTVLANGILIALPTTVDKAGQIDIYYGSPTAGASTDLIVDVVGYTTSSGLIDLAKRVEQLETSGVAPASISTGEQGPAGSNGAQGVPGEQGPAGVAPARVLWVAESGGDYTTLSAALAAIPGDDVDERREIDGEMLLAATEDNPYVIKIAPGTYEEVGPVVLKSYVDVEGSGQGVTTITCECGSNSLDGSAATVSASNIQAEIRHLTIANTTGLVDFFELANPVVTGVIGVIGVTPRSYSTGVATFDTDESFSMNNVTATATGGGYMSGVANFASSPLMNNVTATATGDFYSAGVANFASSSPLMNNVTATATGTNSAGVFNQQGSSPLMNNVTATAIGDVDNGGGGVGVLNDSSSATIRNSSITGNTNSIALVNLSLMESTANMAPITKLVFSTADVAGTLLDGSVSVDESSSIKCFATYDEHFNWHSCSQMGLMDAPK